MTHNHNNNNRSCTMAAGAPLETATAKVSGATIVLGGAQAEVRASWWEQQQARLDAELVRAAAAALRR